MYKNQKKMEWIHAFNLSNLMQLVVLNENSSLFFFPIDFSCTIKSQLKYTDKIFFASLGKNVFIWKMLTLECYNRSFRDFLWH